MEQHSHHIHGAKNNTYEHIGLDLDSVHHVAEKTLETVEHIHAHSESVQNIAQQIIVTVVLVFTASQAQAIAYDDSYLFKVFGFIVLLNIIYQLVSFASSVDKKDKNAPHTLYLFLDGASRVLTTFIAALLANTLAFIINKHESGEPWSIINLVRPISVIMFILAIIVVAGHETMGPLDHASHEIVFLEKALQEEREEQKKKTKKKKKNHEDDLDLDLGL